MAMARQTWVVEIGYFSVDADVNLKKNSHNVKRSKMLSPSIPPPR